MKRYRQVLHIAFWSVYFLINLFNELYLSVSFTSHPDMSLFRQAFMVQFLVLLIKIPAVYYVLYSLIPRWLNAKSKGKLFFEGFVSILFFAFAYRLIMQLIIWPYITFNNPGHLTLFQLTARYFYSVLDLLQIIGIAAAIKLFRLKLEALKKEKSLIREKLQSEMLHLKAQMNPHFLFNTLNSIYALARIQSAQTPEIVMKLSNILRYMLYETSRKTTPIESEITIIEDYIDLQRLRFGNKLKVEYNKSIEDVSAHVVPLLVLPLVENAFKHGNNGNGSHVKLDMTIRKNHLEVSVVNPVASGVHINHADGIGLSNLKRQLELTYKTHLLEYGKEENNFKVNLHIDLNTYSGNELSDS
jgi:two-component system, LytTR family, sensor kinase